MGDAVCLVPFLRRLKEIFPGCAIDVLCERRNAGVFGLTGDLVRRRIRYDRTGFAGDLFAMRRQGYDIVFDTEQWHYFSALIGRGCRPGLLAGFDTRPARSRLYDLPAPYAQDAHETVNFLRLLAACGCAASAEGAQVPFIFADSRQVPEAVRGQDRIVCLGLGSAVSQRSWPQEYWAEAAGYCLSRGYAAVLLGGRGERDQAGRICRAAGQKARAAGRPALIDLTGRTSLAQAAGVLSRARLYVGVDSGLLHLAWGLGVPTISLFGPGIRQKWQPAGPAHRAIGKDLACSPCTIFGYTPGCRGNRCMRSILPQDVIACMQDLLPADRDKGER